MTPRAALYCRVSTQDQVARHSLPMQEKMLREYADAHGMEIVGVYIEKGKSAKNLDRPEVQRLLRDVDADLIDAILVLEVDRLLRNVEDVLPLFRRLAAHSCDVYAILHDDKPIDVKTARGRKQAFNDATDAGFEREHAGERIKRGQIRHATRGGFNGGKPPFGYMTQRAFEKRLTAAGKTESEAKQEAARRFPERGKLYVFEEEADAARSVFTLFLETNSLRKTANTLNGLGILTRKQQRWQAGMVRDTLTNPIYMGRVQWGRLATDPLTGTRTPQDSTQWIDAAGTHEALIDLAMFDRVQEQVVSRFKPTKARRTYLLSGLVKCGQCGSKYGVNSSRKYSYYVCLGRQASGSRFCRAPILRADVFEPAVVAKIRERAQDAHFLEEKAAILDALRDALQQPVTRQADLDRQIAEHRRKIDTLLDAMLSEGYQADPTFKAKYETLKTELTALEREQASTQHSRRARMTEFDTIQTELDRLQSFGEQWDALPDQAAQQAYLRGMVKELIVTEEQIEVVFLDEAAGRGGCSQSVRHASTYRTVYETLFRPIHMTRPAKRRVRRLVTS